MKQVCPGACYSREPTATRNLAARQEGTGASLLTRLVMTADRTCRILVWAGIRWLEDGASVIE
jgi:hypothetical protein